MALNKTKTDPELGHRVHEHLVLNRVETPTVPSDLSDADKTNAIEHHFRGIMETLGLDLTDDSLIDSPRRVAKMFVSDPGRTTFESWCTLERTDQPGVVFAAGGATTIWVNFPNQKAVALPDWVRALVSD